MPFFIPTQMSDYKNRTHPLINGKRTTRNEVDAENEKRAMYVLSQEFCSRVDFFSDDPHCEIDFAAKSPSGEIKALFEFKKRGGNHDDHQYRRGWWLPCIKFDALIRYGIFERKNQGKAPITELYYCWGFNDGLYYINVQQARVWLFDQVMAGLNYRVEEKKNGGREMFYLIPPDCSDIKKVEVGAIDMPWRYQSNAFGRG